MKFNGCKINKAELINNAIIFIFHKNFNSLGLVSKQAYSNTINIVIGFIAGAINTIIVLPRAFQDSLDDWGLLKLILSFAVILAPIFGFGVNNIVIKEYAGNQDINYRKSILGFSLLIAIIGSFLLFLFIYSGSLILFVNSRDAVLIQEYLFLLFVLSVSLTLNQVFTGFIVASHKTPIVLFVSDTFLKISYLILSLAYLYFSFEFGLFLKIFVWIYVFSLAIYIIYAKIIGFTTSFRFKILEIKELITYGVYTVLDRGAGIIVANLDLIMIAYLLELSNVAIYGLAFFIAAVILIPQKAILAPSLPLVSKAVKDDKLVELKRLYDQSSINQLIIGGVLFILIWVNIDGIFSLIPSDFSQGKWVVFYIGVSRLIVLSTGISGPIILFSKYFRINLVFNLFLVGLTIFSNYILINKYGMTGAAIATAITFLTYNILKVVYIQYRFKMQPFTIETIKTLLVLLIVGFLGSYIEIFPQFPLISIVVKSSIIAVLLTLGLYGLKVKAEILDVPKNLLNKVKS